MADKHPELTEEQKMRIGEAVLSTRSGDDGTSHLSEEDFAGYAAEFLDQEDRNRIEFHLSKCDPCLTKMEATIQVDGSWEDLAERLSLLESLTQAESLGESAVKHVAEEPRSPAWLREAALTSLQSRDESKSSSFLARMRSILLPNRTNGTSSFLGATLAGAFVIGLVVVTPAWRENRRLQQKIELQNQREVLLEARITSEQSVVDGQSDKIRSLTARLRPKTAATNLSGGLSFPTAALFALTRSSGDIRGTGELGAISLLSPSLGQFVPSQHPIFRWSSTTNGDGSGLKYVVQVFQLSEGNRNLLATSPALTSEVWRSATPLPHGLPLTWQVKEYQDGVLIDAAPSLGRLAPFEVIDQSHADATVRSLIALARDEASGGLLTQANVSLSEALEIAPENDVARRLLKEVEAEQDELRQIHEPGDL